MADNTQYRILVVDDDPAVRRMLSLTLPGEGFSILDAADGPEALALLQASGSNIAAALIDVCMPGMDGPSVAWSMREAVPGLPVCLMTGNANSYYDPTLRAIGPVLRKPFRPADAARLLAWIGRNWSDSREPADVSSRPARAYRDTDTLSGNMSDTRTGTMPASSSTSERGLRLERRFPAGSSKPE